MNELGTHGWKTVVYMLSILVIKFMTSNKFILKGVENSLNTTTFVKDNKAIKIKYKKS